MTTSNSPAADVCDFDALQSARKLWQAGELDSGIEAYRHALSQAPDNVRVLVECARAFGHRYDVAEAERLLTRAAHLADGDPRLAPAIAQSYGRIYRPARAIQELQLLWRAGHLPLQALVELAILYEQSYQLDDALAAISDVVAATDRAEPRFVLARIQRLRGEGNEARRLFEHLLSLCDSPPLLRIRVWSELALLYDASQDYHGAIQALERAKEIRRSGSGVGALFSRSQAINRAASALHRQLTPQVLADWVGEQQRFPARVDCAGMAHLLSFPRSGTTLLEQAIACHPAIMDSPERTVFAREVFPRMCQATQHPALTLPSLQDIPSTRMQALRQMYLSYMEEAAGEPIAGRIHLDKNPNHTSLLAPLLRLFGDAKILFALRDPRDVVVSNFFQYYPLTEFSVNFLSWESTCAQYAQDLSLWLEMRKLIPGQFLEVKYEDVIADRDGQVTGCLRFLGIDPAGMPGDYDRQQRGKFVGSPSQALVRQPLYHRSHGRWRHYSKFFTRHINVLTPYLRTFGYDE